MDKISCQSFVDWTYEENSETDGRTGLLKIQLISAMNIVAGKRKCIAITSVTKKELEENYCQDSRGMFHVSIIVESAEELNIPFYISEEDSVLKAASLLKWKGVSFCILTGNSLLLDKARKAGFEVCELKDSGSLL